MSNKRLNILIILFLDAILMVFGALNIDTMVKKAVLDISAVNSNKSSSNNINSIFSSDIIKSIDNYKYNGKFSIELIIDKFRAGDSVNVKLGRAGRFLTIRTVLLPYYTRSYFIIMIFTGLVFLLTAILVLFKVNDGYFAGVFHWFLISAVVKLFFSWGSLEVYSGAFNLTLRSLNDISFILLPILFIDFSFLAPRRKWIKSDKFFIRVYFCSILILIPVIWLNSEYIFQGSLNSMVNLGRVSDNLIKVLLIPCFIFVIGNFIHSYRGSRVDSEKRKLLWILTGLLSGPAVYVFLYRLPEWALGKTLISETVMIAFLVISPLTLYTAVFKYRFLDIQILIKRSFVYGFVLTFLLFLYFVIILALTQFTERNTGRFYNIPDGIAALALVFVFQPLKKSVQGFVDRKFFKVDYDYKTVQEQFLEQCHECLTQTDLCQLIKKTINDCLPAESLNLFKYSSEIDGLEILLSEGNSLSVIGCRLLVDSESVTNSHGLKTKNQKLFARRRAIDGEVDFIDRTELLTEINCELVFMSISEMNGLLTVMALGSKKSGFIYKEQDILLLKFISIEFGNTMQKLDLQRDVMFHMEEIKKLEQLNSMKTYFVSSVSHELKSPLTSIRLFSEIINMKKSLSDEQKSEYLEIIQGECDRLNRLVDNILDFSKIERGSKQFRFEIVNLNDIIDSVLKTLNYVLKLKKFNVIYSMNESNFIIKADADSLREVFINLIDNAVKYSDQIREVSVRTIETGNDYCIEISDKGIGISNEDKTNIFKPFFRSNDKNVSSVGGTGIGLSLVKSIITAHNGSIELESALGSGSTFKIFLPKYFCE